jgi:hypothetical protein
MDDVVDNLVWRILARIGVILPGGEEWKGL